MGKYKKHMGQLRMQVDELGAYGEDHFIGQWSVSYSLAFVK